MALGFMWSAELIAIGLIWPDKFETLLGTWYSLLNTVAVRTIWDWPERVDGFRSHKHVWNKPHT